MFPLGHLNSPRNSSVLFFWISAKVPHSISIISWKLRKWLKGSYQGVQDSRSRCLLVSLDVNKLKLYPFLVFVGQSKEPSHQSLKSTMHENPTFLVLQVSLSYLKMTLIWAHNTQSRIQGSRQMDQCYNGTRWTPQPEKKEDHSGASVTSESESLFWQNSRCEILLCMPSSQHSSICHLNTNVTHQNEDRNAAAVWMTFGFPPYVFLDDLKLGSRVVERAVSHSLQL